uniref:Uncharacterized protein n=1 Tax=Leersia perrieri TaxID=77586 RepID=A0A0D9WPW3_9ORYZ
MRHLNIPDDISDVSDDEEWADPFAPACGDPGQSSSAPPVPAFCETPAHIDSPLDSGSLEGTSVEEEVEYQSDGYGGDDNDALVMIHA